LFGGRRLFFSPYSELKDKNFEIVSVAQDTGGVKDAGKWIEAAKPEYTVPFPSVP
jgi:hypothetical protein